MLSKQLISFSKNLSYEFINHIHSANNLCIYKLGLYHVPENIIFPKAKSITLINCNKHSILSILTPTIFPNLSSVNYLSADPGDFKIYERFNNNTKWIFPNKTYEFYDFMVKNGRGRKDSDLIKTYITNKKIIDGNNGFDISFQFDLNIPGFGIVDGEWWRSQFHEYFVTRHYINNSKYCMYPGEMHAQDTEEQLLQTEYVKSVINDTQFDFITEKDN
jgi:hypothetical protein